MQRKDSADNMGELCGNAQISRSKNEELKGMLHVLKVILCREVTHIYAAYSSQICGRVIRSKTEEGNCLFSSYIPTFVSVAKLCVSI